jgi:AhpD family alkylhydroperoxidase
MTIRLGVLRNGQRLRAKVALRLIGVVGRTDPDPVVRLILYRPGLFGRAFNRLAASVMRGPSGWTPGERERIAAHVSRSNDCSFCLGVHSTIAGLRDAAGLSAGHAGVEAEGGRVGALCAFLEHVRTHQDAVSTKHVDAVRSAGVSDDEIGDALSVAFVFDTINRIANAFDFSYETDVDKLRLARGLDRIGYKVPSLLMN